jgi:preprotein translocase subunit SecA
MTFQRFFPRYLRLAGASGTLAESRGELRQVYGLSLVAIPRRAPSRLVVLPTRILGDSARLWERVAAEAARVACEGRAVLVGTESVAQSQALSRVLTQQGLAHQVLNARQDHAESALIAAAGAPGRVTVATSMAGRGTGIACDAQVLEKGGLHVILCQVNASARIDRQFLERAGRQAQPGSVQRLLAADFPVLRRWWPAWWLRAVVEAPGLRMLATLTVSIAQRRESFTHRYERAKLSRVGEALERDLAFGRQVLQ